MFYCVLILFIFILLLLLFFYKVSFIKNEVEGYHVPTMIPNRVTHLKTHKIPYIFSTTAPSLFFHSTFADIYRKHVYQNPEYEIVVFDDDSASIFIEQHFSHRVLQAFHQLNVNAYRADFFRYCFLYIRGGVYLDMNKESQQPFRNIIPPDQEIVLVEDRLPGDIFQAFMACVPNHPFLHKIIDACVDNIEKRFYGKNSLSPTGPHLVGMLYSQYYGHPIQSDFYLTQDGKYICHKHMNEPCIKTLCMEKKENQKIWGQSKTYNELWKEHQIYRSVYTIRRHVSGDEWKMKNSKIPARVCMTYKSNKIHPRIGRVIEQNMKKMKKYTIDFYDDQTALSFLYTHFPNRVGDAYVKVVPGAYKADLFRYCCLYITGGVYLDINKRLLHPLHVFHEQLSINTQLVLVLDIGGKGFFQAFIMVNPKHPFLLECIQQCVSNIESNYYGTSPLDPTGPNMMMKVFRRFYGIQHDVPVGYFRDDIYILQLEPDENQKYYIMDEHKNKFVDIAPIPVQTRVTLDTSSTQQKPYSHHWYQRHIYHN